METLLQSQPSAELISALTPRDPSPSELGRRIKLMRVSLGLTLKNVEDRGSISATHVSEIERGKASPTVGALAKIARALGVRPSALIEPEVLPHLSHVPAEERGRSRWCRSIEPLTRPIVDSRSGAYLVTLEGGTEGFREDAGHPGEEWVMALEGVAEVRVGDRSQVLREGDCVHFRADREHAFVNLGNVPARLLVACRPRMAV